MGEVECGSDGSDGIDGYGANGMWEMMAMGKWNVGNDGYGANGMWEMMDDKDYVNLGNLSQAESRSVILGHKCCVLVRISDSLSDLT